MNEKRSQYIERRCRGFGGWGLSEGGVGSGAGFRASACEALTCVRAAAALRVRGLGALRHARHRRPSILGRDGFFVRYAEPEKAAVATFDFLDELSAGSSPDSKHK